MSNPSVGVPQEFVGQTIFNLTLDNGVDVHLVNEAERSRTLVTLEVRNPDNQERPEYRGLGYLAAISLVFGSGNYPGPNEFVDFFEGSNFKVVPSTVNTKFHYAIDSADLDESLNRISDAISVPELPRNTPALLKRFLSKRYRAALDNWNHQVAGKEELLYGAPSTRYFSLLNQSDIRNRIHEYIARFYQPSNLRLVIAYDNSISREEVIEIVTQNFDDIADQRRNVMGEDDYLDSSSVVASTVKSLHSANLSSTESDENLTEFNTSTPGSATADDVFTMSQLYAATEKPILWITFPTPFPSFSSEIYWNYILSNTGEGALGNILQTLQLITNIATDSYYWNVAGEASRRTLILHLTDKGAESIGLILSLLFEYVSIVKGKEITHDVYTAALNFFHAQEFQKLKGNDGDMGRWSYIIRHFIDAYGKPRNTTFDPLSIAEEGRHFSKEKCTVIHVSEAFIHLDRETDSEFFLFHNEVSVTLPSVPVSSKLRFPDRPIALPESLTMAIDSANRGRDTGFVELSQYPLVAQRWTAGHDLVMKLKLPLTKASDSAGRVLASVLYLRLRSSESKGLFSGSAEYAGGALDITIQCFPDALLGVIEALFTLVKTKCSLTGEELAGIKASLSAEFNNHLADQLTPAFNLDFEQLIGLRSFESELADLKDVTADNLPSIEPGYFAMLLVGNVNRVLTDEASKMVAYHTGSKMTQGPYRPVTTESLPENIVNAAPVVRSLRPYPHEGSAFLFAFRLGDYTTEMMAKAVAFASIAATVVRQDLCVGNLIAPHTASKAVQARGHVWLVIEVIGHRGYNYVAPFVNKSVIKSMDKAFDVLNEDDMVAARGRARQELFEPRDTMEEEADRLWHPMYWAGEPYVLETIEALDATKSDELSDWYFDLVQSGETRECITVFYKRKGFPDPPASEEFEVVEAEVQSDSDSD